MERAIELPGKMKLKAFSLLPILVGLADAQLGLKDGFVSFTTSAFSIQLVKDSQTLFSLKPSGSSFDFIPGDQMSAREANGHYHLGDITFRARQVGSTTWLSGDTSTTRRVLTPLAVSGNTLAAANLAPTLPSNSLLSITRRWVNNNGQLQLLFDVQNSQTFAVEIGSLGVPLEFNNVGKGLSYTGRHNLTNLDRYSLLAPPQTPMRNVVFLTHILVKMPVLYKLLLYWEHSRLSSSFLSGNLL